MQIVLIVSGPKGNILLKASVPLALSTGTLVYLMPRTAEHFQHQFVQSQTFHELKQAFDGALSTPSAKEEKQPK